jgi:DNA-cytosine methyltransferase
MKRLKFLSLFAGIGGFDRGFEQAGMRCIGQVDIDPFCLAVLTKHWPDVPKWTDIKKFKGSMLEETPDVICGGFPCQDISCANPDGKGLEGERSGLWYEFLRLLCEIRPRYAVVENVPALLVRGVDEVLKGLAEIGYDAEWQIIPASAFGAPHRRERFFLVAYRSVEHPEGVRIGGVKGSRVESGAKTQSKRKADYNRPDRPNENSRTALGRTGGCFGMVYSEFRRSVQQHLFAMLGGREGQAEQTGMGSGKTSKNGNRTMAKSDLKRLAGRRGSTLGTEEEESLPAGTGSDGYVPHPTSTGRGEGEGPGKKETRSGRGQSDNYRSWCGWPSGPGQAQHGWEQPRLVKFEVGGDVDGVPLRLVRFANRSSLKAFGNSVVPQVVGWIAQRLVQVHQADEEMTNG